MFTQRKWRYPPMWKSTADLLNIQDDLNKEIEDIRDIIATLKTFKRTGNRGYIRLLQNQLDQCNWLHTLNAADIKRNKEQDWN